MKKLIVASAIALFAALIVQPLVASDKLTTVAVIDIERVYETYYESSQGMREYNQQRDMVQKEIRALTVALQALQNKLIAAKAAVSKGSGNAADVLKLEQEVLASALYLKDYQETKRQELAAMKANLNKGDAFMKELYRAVEYVATSQGFTIVLTTEDNVFWYSSPVDITGKVLEHLKKSLK